MLSILGKATDILDAASRLFLGYDFFISYSRRDGSRYAQALEEQLRGLDYSCFLDRREVSGGSELTPTLERALRRSRALVVIGTAGALSSSFVALEIARFPTLRRKKPVIPIDVAGIRLQALWPGFADRVWLEEDGPTEAPSPRVLAELQQSMTSRRRYTVWRTILAAVALCLLILGALSLVQWRRAEQRYRTALSRQLAAQALQHLDDRLDLSLLLAVEAWKAGETLEAESSLLSALEHSPHLTTFLVGHTRDVYALAFSPDGKILASAGFDRRIQLWDVATHRPLGSPWTGHRGYIFDLAFHPGGTLLAAGGQDGRVLLWKPMSHQLVGKPIISGCGSVLNVAFSSDGRTLVAGGGNCITLWDLAKRTSLGPPLVGDDSLVDLLASHLGTVRPRKIDALRQSAEEFLAARQRRFESWGTSVAFSPDGKRVATPGDGDTITLRNPATWEPLGASWTGHKDSPWSLAFSPDGKTLASGGFDATILLWDPENGQPVAPPLVGHRDKVVRVTFSRDGQTLASGGSDGTVILWSRRDPRWLVPPPGGNQGTILQVAFSPGGKLLASAGQDGSVVLWDIATGRQIARPLSSGAYPVSGLSFSPNGHLLAMGRDLIWLWDLEKNRPVHGPLGSQGPSVTDVVFSPDGRLLASGWSNDLILLWDTETWKPLAKVVGPAKGWRDLTLAFSTDSRTLASASLTSGENAIHLWDVPGLRSRGRPLHLASPAGEGESKGLLYEIEQVAASNLAFRPDGSLLAAGRGQEVTLWDPTTGRLLDPPLLGHRSTVLSLAFRPDGQMLASGGAEGVLLWDPQSRQRIGPLLASNKAVRTVAFSPDGRLLASAGEDATISLHELSIASWISRACSMANRNLSSEEWAQYLGQEPYRETCPSR
jgi:WD40 repeat protein